MAKVEIRIPDWLDKICAWPVTAYRKYKYGYAYRSIYLGEGRFTIVEPEDYYRFGHFNWYISGHEAKFYAVRSVMVGQEETKTVRLHREIMRAPDELLVDHRNGNSLDNRRANLRMATTSQNAINRRKNKTNTSSRFRGVFFRKRRGRWVAAIYPHRKMIWLGTFDSEIDAAKAYDAGAKKYYGEFARLNFAENTDLHRQKH